MGKLESNKKKKEDALYNTAFELFTTKGTNKLLSLILLRKPELPRELLSVFQR